MSVYWKLVPNATLYLPALNAAEDRYAIPNDLLARIAFQESSFLDSVVNGTQKSSAGCVGLMQLNPHYFPDAGKDWHVDIQTAASEVLMPAYHRFKDWQLATIAYNDGAGNIDLWLKGQRALPVETEKYLAQVMADVPLSGQVIETQEDA